MVVSNPVEGREDEFTEWYNNVHVPDVLKVEGVLTGHRYELTHIPTEGLAPPKNQFLAVYEVEGDADAILAELRAKGGTAEMPVSEAFDRASAGMTIWKRLI